MTGISNGLSALTMFAAVRNGPITLVAPLAAIYPLVTVALSAMLLKHIEITARIVAGAALAGLRGALVLIGFDRFGIGKTPLLPVRLCDGPFGCQNGRRRGIFGKPPTNTSTR